MRGRHWAEWFAVISAGLTCFGIQAFRPPRQLVSAGVIFFNLLIIVYLASILKQQRTHATPACLHTLPPPAPEIVSGHELEARFADGKGEEGPGQGPRGRSAAKPQPGM